MVDVLYEQIFMAATLAAGGTLSDFEPGKKRLLELKKLGVRVLPSNEAMAQALQSGEVWITPMWRAARGPVAERRHPGDQTLLRARARSRSCSISPCRRTLPTRTGAYAWLNASLEPQAQIAFAAKDGLCADRLERAAAAGARPEAHLQRRGAGQAEVADYGYMAKEFQSLKQ